MLLKSCQVWLRHNEMDFFQGCLLITGKVGECDTRFLYQLSEFIFGNKTERHLTVIISDTIFIESVHGVVEPIPANKGKRQ